MQGLWPICDSDILRWLGTAIQPRQIRHGKGQSPPFQRKNHWDMDMSQRIKNILLAGLSSEGCAKYFKLLWVGSQLILGVKSHRKAIFCPAKWPHSDLAPRIGTLVPPTPISSLRVLCPRCASGCPIPARDRPEMTWTPNLYALDLARQGQRRISIMEFEKAWETLDKVEPTHMDIFKWSSPRVIGLVGSSQTGFNIFIFIQQTIFYTHTYNTNKWHIHTLQTHRIFS